MKSFATSFNQADILITTEVYPAGEAPIAGISGKALYEEIEQFGHKNVHFEPDMKKKISEQGLQKHINLKGILDYDRFSEVVSSYDIFIGSGSAIVQAAGLGVSAIVGIENTASAETYGFLAELDGFSYNEDGLYAKRPIVEVLQSYSELPTDARVSLSQRHIDKAKEFSMAKCVDNFDRIPRYTLNAKSVFGRLPFLTRFCYSASLFMSSLKARLSNSSLSERVRENSV